MGSKQTYAILFLLLIASLAGTFAVFNFYVKERWIELGEHEKEEEQLRKKISDMETKFFHTTPEAILELWRNKKQPWTNATIQRAEFFEFIPIEPTEPPDDGTIPKFWYREEFPKLKKQIFDEAYNNGTTINSVDFRVDEPDTYGSGTNPSLDVVLNHVGNYKYGMEMVRLLFRAKVISINNLIIWPQVTTHKGRSGDIMTRRTGYSLTIRMQDLVSLLNNMRLENQYFNIEVIKITNQALRDVNPVLNVELVVTQAGYQALSESEAASASMAASGASPLMSSLFSRSSSKAEAPKVGIMKRIMMLFPF